MHKGRNYPQIGERWWTFFQSFPFPRWPARGGRFTVLWQYDGIKYEAAGIAADAVVDHAELSVSYTFDYLPAEGHHFRVQLRLRQRPSPDIGTKTYLLITVPATGDVWLGEDGTFQMNPWFSTPPPREYRPLFFQGPWEMPAFGQWYFATWGAVDYFGH